MIRIFAITIPFKTTMPIYLIIHILIQKFFDFIELQVMVTAPTMGKYIYYISNDTNDIILKAISPSGTLVISLGLKSEHNCELRA